MESNPKVFSSDIIRTNSELNNNLYELLKIVPAEPTPDNVTSVTSTCDFQPRTDKCYAPKKKSKFKVKTVRNIREVFEKDVLVELNVELEKHRNTLLRKIRIGSSREEATKKMAKVMLRGDSPITKDIWQMLTNINPEGHLYSAQFVLWNRKNIQINGSRGGKNKFIFSFDVGHHNFKNSRKVMKKSNKLDYSTKLLHKSLHINFRPGPLSKKQYLDSSYQKYQYGNTDIVSLPKPGLDIQPTYGIPLAQPMIRFLSENYMQNSDGQITEKWADFSLSVLGVNDNGCPVQVNKDSCITFDLEYKCKQNRILMRNASEHKTMLYEIEEFSNQECKIQSDEFLTAEVKNIVNRILDFVEIKNEVQNQCSRIDDDSKFHLLDENKKLSNSKEKLKRKFGELDRLDVTVIKLSSDVSEISAVNCKKDFCSLGCICDSIESSYKLKTHCGRIDCMFECKCVKSMQWFPNSPHNSLSLANLDDLNKKLKSGLAKEEQKFRQTVIFSGDKSIVLKSQRRDWKSSKKYADFFSTMCLKTETKCKNVLYIVTPKLNCSNIEPWCMVHNLYRCFCKGKFTEKAIIEENNLLENNNDVQNSNKVVTKKTSFDEPLKQRLRIRMPAENNEAKIVIEDSISQLDLLTKDDENDSRCARLDTYNGRKYSDAYYRNTNQKICEMEKNDRSLLKKMIHLIQQSDRKFNKEDKASEDISDANQIRVENKKLLFKNKLYAWIEASYKNYKKCLEKGIVVKALEPPQESKWSFHSWEFILGRYREGKNLFLVTSGKPFRIYLAINKEHPKLLTCVNIKHIPSNNLEEYPITVKNLITNSIDLKNTFCVLRGLSYCWEFIGTVTKVSNSTEVKENNNFSTLDCDNVTITDEDSLSDSKLVDDSLNVVGAEENPSHNKPSEKEDPQSKWFVMTVENDFNEIHFYKKGFFVKYDSVIRAINVSRATNKTVRLSSQKCNSAITNPQFGIYAIPNKENLTVFIGPYERDEPLGIETVKTTLPRLSKNKSKGTWLFVNKIDNIKIIDQSLSFLPKIEQGQESIPLDSNEVLSSSEEADNVSDTNKIGESAADNKQNKASPAKKVVKPIKIRKSDGFFQLCTKVVEKGKSSALVAPCKIKVVPNITTLNSLNKTPSIISTADLNNTEKHTITPCKPIAEIAPQVKVVQNNEKVNTSVQRTMSVLNPAQINSRSLLDKIAAGPSNTTNTKDEINSDIETFLASSPVCTVPNSEVLIISDEEDEEKDVVKDVYLQAKNILNLGWIPAKRDFDKRISFEFPGFKYSEFYPEDVAFHKINLVLSRKVLVPKLLEINWEVITNLKDLRTKEKLLASDLRPDMIMTKKGLRSRPQIDKLNVKGKSPLTSSTEDTKRKLLTALDDFTSTELDNNNKRLCIEAVTRKSEILQSISEASSQRRKEMSERLNSLLMDSKNCQ